MVAVSHLGNLLALFQHLEELSGIFLLELDCVDRVRIVLEKPFVLPIVFLLLMDFLLGLGTFVTHHEHSLLLGVLFFDLVNHFLGSLLISSH